jgi:hypothetical protein
MDFKVKIFLTLLPFGIAMPSVSAADSGFYLGASIGSASLEEDFDGFDVDDDTEAYRVIGGLQFGETFGIEAGYQNFGDFTERFDLGGTTAITRLTADGWTLGGTVGIPVGESASLFGRGGIFVWDADVEIDGIRAAVDDDSNPYYGVGAKVDFTRNFSLVGDWTRYELDDVDSDVISLGFEFRFGN